jgi:restriction endonuclease Mrr
MAQISSQAIANWAIHNLESTDWISLSEICAVALKKQDKFDDATIEESVERELNFVAEILRNKAANALENGELVTYEIDNEESPYIRKVHDYECNTLKKIQELAPNKFEILCAELLKELGWNNAAHIGSNQDDGVDFCAFGFPNSHIFNLPMPTSCKVLVIGQAKRYKQNNNVSETEIRKFVGGALKKLNDFRKSGNVGVLTPVIFAFWISSDFDNPAKEYAKTMGIWFMNGRTLIEYLNKLHLEELIS